MVAALRATLSGLTDDLRQPEIQNLRLSSIRDEDVRGLDVAVDDALRVGRVQSIGDLDAKIEHSLDLQRLAADPVPERLPLQQFHGDEGSPIGLVNLVDRADVRVVQGGRSLGFPLETAEGLRDRWRVRREGTSGRRGDRA